MRFDSRGLVSTYISDWMPTNDRRVSVAGYFGGGAVSGGGLTNIDKLAFGTETKSTISATLTTAIYAGGSCANSGVAGYFGGGYDYNASVGVTSIQKLAFPADTKTNLVAVLGGANINLASMANSGVAGYFGGGDEVDRIDKLTFSSDTRATLAAVLSTPI